VLYRVAFPHPEVAERICWFDEALRQSEDIEMWLRLAIKGGVCFEGIAPDLTEYRLASGGLSAQVLRQYQSWLAVVERLESYAPEFAARHLPRARAYQLRYLARRSVQLGDPTMAVTLLREAARSSLRPLFEEPVKTVITAVAVITARLMKPERFARMSRALSGGSLIA
jgi:hypothetical protein